MFADVEVHLETLVVDACCLLHSSDKRCAKVSGSVLKGAARFLAVLPPASTGLVGKRVSLYRK